MKLFAVHGNTQSLDGGAMFGNAPKNVWQTWMIPDQNNRVPLACRCLLIADWNGKNILFEAGIGSFFDDKMRERYGVVESKHVLVHNLEELGVSHDSIDAVILSHLHFDHAGGLLSAYGEGPLKLLFPKAKFYVSAEHWQRAKNPHFRDRASFIPALNTLLEQSGRLVLVQGAEHPDLFPLVRFSYSQGHTPGLMLANIDVEGFPLLFASDLIPGLPWVHVPIVMGYDRFAELVVDEKKLILEDLYNKQGLIFFTHDPLVSCGYVCKGTDGKFFVKPVDVEKFNDVYPV